MKESGVRLFRSNAATANRMRGMRLIPAAATLMSCVMAETAFADMTPQTANGVPQQIIPQYQEIGIGNFQMPGVTATGLGGNNGGTGGGNGAGGSTAAGAGASGASTSSNALDTMMATSWGAAAAQNAQALGVNASALAATCVVESGCQNLSGTGSITGAFQMTSATYQSSLNAALQQNPNLASNIVDGLAGQNDPATQSIAAAEYLKQGAQYLQSQGVSDPSVLDVRGYYNFGPQGGAAIATADDSDLMSDKLSMYTPNQLAQNGITPGETVGQWRSSVASKIGNAANAQVLL
jgi:hypothetical protein